MGMGGMGGMAAAAAASAMRSPAASASACSGRSPRSLVAQVYLLGLCLVYLRVTEGLDLSATEAALRQKLEEARSRAGDLGEKARAAANRATAPTSARAAADAAAARTTRPAPGAAPPSYPAGAWRPAAPSVASFAAVAPGADRRAAGVRRRPLTLPPADAGRRPRPTSTCRSTTSRRRDDRRRRFRRTRRRPTRRRPTCRRRPPPPHRRAPAASTCPQCLSPVTSDGRLLRRLRLPPEVTHRGTRLAP